MVDAKREHDGFLAAFTAAVVVARIPWTGKDLDPHQLNPFREVDAALEAELRELKRFIAATAMAVQVEEGVRAARKGKKG